MILGRRIHIALHGHPLAAKILSALKTLKMLKLKTILIIPNRLTLLHCSNMKGRTQEKPADNSPPVPALFSKKGQSLYHSYGVWEINNNASDSENTAAAQLKDNKFYPVAARV